MVPAPPKAHPAIRRVLHVFHLCGVAGTEAVIRHLIRGFAELGVESEAFFQRDIGGSQQFLPLCPIHFEPEISLEALLGTGRFDAVHAITSALTLDLPRAVQRSGFAGPVLTACHNDYIVGWNRSNADGVVALTGEWAGRIRPFTDLPVEVIGNPIDPQRFAPPESSAASGKPILAWVGRSSDPWKNIGRLLELIPRLADDAFEIHVADTNLRESPEALFGSLAHRVHWYGKLPYADMPAFYQKVAASRGVLLSTSDNEAFPMCVLEAMASGCPAIVPDAWGAAEIVTHRQSGLVYPPRRGAEAIAQCLTEAKAPGLWEQLSRGARKTVEERYVLPVIARRYLELLEQCAGRTRARSWSSRTGWALRSLGFYARTLPAGVALYRPRRAAEALERAAREDAAGSVPAARAALLEALRMNPLVYLRPWRAKFLLRTLVNRTP